MDLFYRNGKRISLNENGQFLLTRVERIFMDIEDMEKELNERKGGMNGELSIISTLPYTFLSILDGFLKNHPNTKILQVPLSKDSLHEFSVNGKFDLCITTERVDDPMMEWRPLYEESIYFSVPMNHHLAKKEEIDLSGMANYPLIGLTKNYEFRQFTDRLCEQFGYYPQYQIEVAEATIILNLVKKGRGMSFTPESATHLYKDEIKHIKINNENFKRMIGLLRHRYLYHSKLSKEFVNHCVEYFQKVKEEGYKN
jgi:DNA-binding transcriptional LysR family regulator